MTRVKVRYTRDAAPFSRGDEVWIEEGLAMHTVVTLGFAEFCDTLTSPPLQASEAGPAPDAAAGAAVTSPPSTPAAPRSSRRRH